MRIIINNFGRPVETFSYSKPSSAGRALRALGYRAKLCYLCDNCFRQRGGRLRPWNDF